MTYWISYNQSNNSLIGVSDTIIQPSDGIIVEERPGDIPDLTKFSWNSATLNWYEKYRKVLTKREFLKKFTPTEYATIKAAAAANAMVDYYWQLFTLALVHLILKINVDR